MCAALFAFLNSCVVTRKGREAAELERKRLKRERERERESPPSNGLSPVGPRTYDELGSGSFLACRGQNKSLMNGQREGTPLFQSLSHSRNAGQEQPNAWTLGQEF